ncbi:MAG TPA: ribose 5-phosphate isomerase B [Rhodospirillales bacterium]|jgi:ribose 5-phosphate isomerase B|nr:ribose 5-phosphate isomerase B [Rhodospirillales bacterium]
MPSETIAIASDHAGFELKTLLVGTLGEGGYQVLDLGTDSTDPVDYPDYANAMNEALASEQARRGVLVCGSGIGVSIAANRHPRIRAALVSDAFGARQCRAHNDANVICFGGRTIGTEVARDCLRIFLETQFEGGRHAARVSKLAAVPRT